VQQSSEDSQDSLVIEQSLECSLEGCNSQQENSEEETTLFYDVLIDFIVGTEFNKAIPVGSLR
jgi:hypothetical protein